MFRKLIIFKTGERFEIGKKRIFYLNTLEYMFLDLIRLLSSDLL